MTYMDGRVSKEASMRVAKWGNSLAVRLPQGVVEALELKEGDGIEIVVAGTQCFEIARDRSAKRRSHVLASIAAAFPQGQI